jgi:two-component system, sensor histidine kinase and response regulator
MSNQVVLCIDDENIVLDSLREQIQQAFGTELIVEVAESGDEALEVFDELINDGYDIPVIIADFIMPGMKGDALLAKIHSIKPAAKKILLTGQASIEGVGNAVNKANLYRFISKPWDKEDLILTIKEAIKSFDQDKTIVKQNEELKELNVNLEKKVEQRTEELKELNATKDKFFSIIAHDLKNPFNTLLGFSELLITNLDTFGQEKINEFVNIIHETSKNSYALLENLLEWSRSQTGRIEMEKKPIDLEEVVEENINLLSNNAAKKDIKLVNNLQPNSKAVADGNMIKTVVRNLISNAIKYTPKGGSITITSKTHKDIVELSITDTGVGIKEENIPKLFRIDMNYTTKGTANETGTGLGLILCKEFISKNDGEISVTSDQEKGSTFTIKLPFSK